MSSRKLGTELMDLLNVLDNQRTSKPETWTCIHILGIAGVLVLDLCLFFFGTLVETLFDKLDLLEVHLIPQYLLKGLMAT